MGAVGTVSGNSGMPQYDYDNPTHFDDEPSHTLKWMQNEKLSNYNEWEDGLSTDELAAIGMFTGTSYDGVYKKLYDVPWEDLTPDQQKYAQDLYDAISKFELRKPIVVFRKTSSKIFGKMGMSDEALKKLEGEIVHSNGFMSTSAGTHGVGVENDDVELEITIPKSVGAGAWVAQKSSASVNEREFLLNNNGFFRVKQVIPGAGHYGSTKVVMDWVGQSKDQIFAKDTPTELKGSVPKETVSKTIKKKKGK